MPFCLGETTLFVDMDGVLADFDRHNEAVFGWRPDKTEDNVDWHVVRAVKGFFADIPPVADLPHLWARIERYRPIVLTGVPPLVQEAADNKRAWVTKNLGAHVEVRCCQSREKWQHATLATGRPCSATRR
jgi:hypothetical protein